MAKPPDIAIGNEFVEEGGWAISRIGARNGGVDLGGVGTRMRRAVPADQTRLDLLPARLTRNLPYYLSVDVTTLSWRHEAYSFENGHCIALMCRYELLSILIIFFQDRFWQPKKPGNDE